MKTKTRILLGCSLLGLILLSYILFKFNVGENSVGIQDGLYKFLYGFLGVSIGSLLIIVIFAPTKNDETKIGDNFERIDRFQKTMESHEENYITSNDVQDLKESYYYKGRRDEAIYNINK